jgi:Cupin domain
VIRALATAVTIAVVSTAASLVAQSTTGRGSAQTPPVAPSKPSVTPAKPSVTPAKPSVAPSKASPVRIAVRDQDGTLMSGVRLLLSGAGTGEFTTGAAGTAVVPNLKDGVYRVRCEREGFITLEREFTVRGAAWNPIDVVLNAAPPPPSPPPPVAKPAPEPSSPPAIPPSGPPLAVSIVDFLDRNFIGREPLKESILACKPLETVRLLQMREGVARHVHERADEIIYVVAGEGAVRIGEEATALRAGSLVLVPNGSGHAFERRGKNPLIIVSTLVGSACERAETAQ